MFRIGGYTFLRHQRESLEVIDDDFDATAPNPVLDCKAHESDWLADDLDKTKADPPNTASLREVGRNKRPPGAWLLAPCQEPVPHSGRTTGVGINPRARMGRDTVDIEGVIVFTLT